MSTPGDFAPQCQTILAHARAGEYLLAWQLYTQICHAHSVEWESTICGPGDGWARYQEISRQLDRLAQELLRVQRRAWEDER